MPDSSLSSKLAALSSRKPGDDDSLHAYIRAILGVHVPRVAVCEGHQSPFSFLADGFFRRSQRQLILAARGTGKTYLASIQNLLKSKFWAGTGTGHYAAVGAQAEWGLGYLKRMLSPAYMHQDVEEMLANEVTWKNKSWVRIGSGKTTTGITAYHPNRLVIDEVDLWDPSAYETAQYMLSGSERNPPELQVASTAYSSFGLMSPLLAQAKKRRYSVYRWCLWENLQPCPTCRGKECPLYQWVNPRTGQQELLCQGRALRSDGFIRYEDAIDEFLRTDSESYLVQKLLDAPERRSLIYPHFDAERHTQVPPKYAQEEAPVGIGVDWGFDHPEVFTVFSQVPNGTYYGLEEHGERFLTPSREMDLAQAFNKKYKRLVGHRRDGSPIYAYPTFYCGRDQPASISAFAEAGLTVVPNQPRFREEGHKEIRRLLDLNHGPLLYLDPVRMPMTVLQLGSIHRDDKGTEVVKDNDYADSARHVLATAALSGGIQAGGGMMR